LLLRDLRCYRVPRDPHSFPTRRSSDLDRRRFLALTLAGVATLAGAGTARAQSTPAPVRRRAATDEHSVTAAVKIEVKARPLPARSEEHTSELQSRSDLVCRLLLEKQKK